MEIDDPDDVVQYLSSFVAAGDDGEIYDDLQKFAQDVHKFKLGEELSDTEDNTKENEKVTKSTEAATAETKPRAKIVLDEAAAQREETKRREAEIRGRQQEEIDRLNKKKEEEEEQMKQREQKQREAAVAAKKKQPEPQVGKKASTDTPQDLQTYPQNLVGTNVQSVASSAVGKNISPKERKANKQQRKPGKGKPKKKACGCYGNKHKPLANCLHCGRISCEEEGIDDYCHFCGNYIQDISAKMNSAMKHKERLLEFDRTSTARTQIHDDQEDYFVASTNMWATDQEQEDAREMEESRRKKLHARQKQLLDINF